MSARLEFPPLPPHNPSAKVLPGNYLGLNRRSRDPIDILSRQLDAICVTAVSPLEIAAALEMDGMTDSLAQEKYGVEDVFALADALYQRVPFRAVYEKKPAPAAAKVSDEAPESWRLDLSRGVLYLLAGLLASVIGGATPQATALGLVISSVGAWAWSQSMVRVSYMLRGRGQPDVARRSLRIFMLLGVALIVFFAWGCSVASGYGADVVLIALVQSLYALAAVIYLTLRKDTLLWLYAAPGFALALALFVARSFGFVPEWLSLASMTAEGVAVMLVVFGAVRLTRVPSLKQSFWTLRPLGLKAADFMETIPFGIYGALCASLLAVDTVVGVFAPEFTRDGAGLSLVPLVLATGAAEWQLRLYREAQVQLMKRTTILSLYGLRSWGLFLNALMKYGLVLLALSLVFGALIELASGFSAALVFGLFTNFVLGVGFFAGFVLMANERVRLASLGVGLALVLRLALFATPYAWLAPMFAAGTLSFVLLVSARSVVVRVNKI